MAENVAVAYLTARLLKLEAIRLADLFRVDWDDNVFKSSGWTTKLKTVAENADTVGWYVNQTTDVSTWDDGDYTFVLTDTTISTRPVSEETVRVAAGLIVDVADVERWRGLAPDALSSGKLPADVKLWLAAAPASLNSGLVQVDVERWVNEVVLGTDGTGFIKANLYRWLDAAPNALSAGRIPVNVDLWVGSTPAGLDAGRVPADVQLWQGDAVAGLIAGRVNANAQVVGDDAVGAAAFTQGAADKVWASAARTLTSFGTLVADAAAAVWAAVTRTLTTSLDPTAAQVRAEIDASSTQLAAVRERTDRLPDDPADESLVIAEIDTRLATASYVAPDNAGIAAIQERTANLPDDPADESLVIAATDAIMTRLGTPATTVSGDIAGDRAVDDAIKVKTDQLQFTTPGLLDTRAFVVDDKTGYHLLTAQGIARATERLLEFVMYNPAGTPLAGLTVTAERSVDGGGLAASTNAPAGIGSGVYKVVASASDLDGGVVTFRFTATGAAPTLLTVFTVQA